SLDAAFLLRSASGRAGLLGSAESQELGGRGFSAARKTFHEDQTRNQALFARSHPGRVDELLGCVVDGAALATWRLQDVEQAWIDRGLRGWRQLHLVGDGAMMIVQQELGIEHAVELPETPDEV